MIDPALRRSGRFDAEIEVTTPNEDDRFHILKVRRIVLIVFSNLLIVLGRFAL